MLCVVLRMINIKSKSVRDDTRKEQEHDKYLVPCVLSL